MTSTTCTISTESDAPRTIEEQGGENLTPPVAPTPAAPALDLPPAFMPNQVERKQNLDKPSGFDCETAWTATGDGYRFALCSTNGHTTYIRLYTGEARGDGFGKSAREAYRAAWREQRLARYDAAALLRERAGLRRMLRQAERKIAADGARLLTLADEAAALKARVAELNDAAGEKSRRIAALEAGLQPKPPRDPGAAVLTLAYLRAWLTNAPLSAIQRDGLEVLLSLAQPWHARGRAWDDVVFFVKRAGISVAPTPVELEARRD